MNIILVIITLFLIFILYHRFKKKIIEEKDFWTIGVILFVAIIGLIQIELKYEAIVNIKQHLQEVVKVTAKNIAYSAGEMNRWSNPKEKLLREKEIRNELYTLLEKLDIKEEERQNILAGLDSWIELDEKELLRKESLKNEH